MIQIIWGTCSFVLSVVFAVLLVGQNLQRRNGFLLRCVLLAFAICALCTVQDAFVLSLDLEISLRLFVRICECLEILLYAGVFAWAVYKCSVQEALFCAAVSYCMEHISQRAAASANEFLGLPEVPYAVLLICITAAFYALMHLFVLRRNDPGRIVRSSRLQILVTFATTLVAIVVNTVATNLVRGENVRILIVCINAMSSLACGLILFLEFYFVKYCDQARERDVLESILRQEKTNYRMERAAMDLINIKCHDMKHQLHAVEKQLVEGDAVKADLAELKSAIYAYDTSFHTGNKALDTMLSLKAMTCEAKRITLTCLADGKLLSFITGPDIYSLFGNILDNAIEACEGLPDESRRVISLNVCNTGGLISIDASNYYDGDLSLSDGLPVTSKSDRRYHGFGMLSIRRLVEKYEGVMEIKTTGGIFSLGITFCTPEKG